MKIDRVETLACDGGWRDLSFLKITTADGIEGWSEFSEAFGTAALSRVIEALGASIVGLDPRRVGAISSRLSTRTTPARGGLNHLAIGAIENALLDIKAKALGVPVYDLFGGAIRTKIPVYWSHCATWRTWYPEALGVTPPKTYDDLAALGAEATRRGFRGLKTNILLPREGGFVGFAPSFGAMPGFPQGSGAPALNWDRSVLEATRRELEALRAGAGAEAELYLDVNFHFKTEGFVRLAEAIAPFRLSWLELDTFDPDSLAFIRAHAPCPIASCETLLGRREFKRFFETYAMDVPIIDVTWNGLLESVRIAAMAEPYEMNVAPHNFYGHLCSMMAAHFSAIVPNLRVMELDVESVRWRDEFFDAPPAIENGMLVLSEKPGWGITVNEAAVRAHPPCH